MAVSIGEDLRHFPASVRRAGGMSLEARSRIFEFLYGQNGPGNLQRALLDDAKQAKPVVRGAPNQVLARKIAVLNQHVHALTQLNGLESAQGLGAAGKGGRGSAVTTNDAGSQNQRLKGLVAAPLMGQGSAPRAATQSEREVYELRRKARADMDLLRVRLGLVKPENTVDPMLMRQGASDLIARIKSLPAPLDYQKPTQALAPVRPMERQDVHRPEASSPQKLASPSVEHSAAQRRQDLGESARQRMLQDAHTSAHEIRLMHGMGHEIRHARTSSHEIANHSHERVNVIKGLDREHEADVRRERARMA